MHITEDIAVAGSEELPDLHLFQMLMRRKKMLKLHKNNERRHPNH